MLSSKVKNLILHSRYSTFDQHLLSLWIEPTTLHGYLWMTVSRETSFLPAWWCSYDIYQQKGKCPNQLNLDHLLQTKKSTIDFLFHSLLFIVYKCKRAYRQVNIEKWAFYSLDKLKFATECDVIYFCSYSLQANE